MWESKTALIIPGSGQELHGVRATSMMYFHSWSSYTVSKALKLYGVLCVILYLNLSYSAAEAYNYPSITSHCSAPTLLETWTPSQNICANIRHECSSEYHVPAVEHPQSPRVAELNETTLEKALDLVHSSNGTYIAVLYYATWCPFSKEVRLVYDVLSTRFPSIHHVAVEESSVRPSVLSQYGVHSFPILFVHNRTARVRYYGPRTLQKLTYFYQNYTGLRAYEGQPGRREDCAFAKLVFNAGNETKDVCPYPWAISPEKWLQDDMYLSLAMIFLLARLLFTGVPALLSRAKKSWDRRSDPKVPLRANYPVQSFDQSSLLGGASQVVEDGDGDVVTLSACPASAKSVPGWSPTSQIISQPSSMAVAESSSSRGGPLDEVNDKGKKQNVDIACLHRGTCRS